MDVLVKSVVGGIESEKEKAVLTHLETCQRCLFAQYVLDYVSSSP